MRRLEFWFDFASTYSYIAAMRIDDLCRDAGVALKWVPFVLGPIFQLQGWNDSPFNLNERRGRYMWRDLERLTAKFGLRWKRPTIFPRASTLAARIASSVAAEVWCGDFVRAVYTANFGDDLDIGEEQVIVGLLDGLGRDGSSIVKRALEPERRGLLRANTERAIELGVFGAPNCVVGRELFWGEEALEDAIAWSQKEG